jgi:hypothetical protein
MGRADYLTAGDYNCVCFECGRKRKASQLKRHWQGYYVCPEHWEPRQPQDFVRGVVDNPSVPWVQPRAQEYIGLALCTPWGRTAIPSRMIPGCSIPTWTSASGSFIVTPGGGPLSCTLLGRSPIPDYAIPDCFLPG